MLKVGKHDNRKKKFLVYDSKQKIINNECQNDLMPCITCNYLFTKGGVN